jgi:hypothetical protein
MAERIVRIPTAQISQEISDFMIGLVNLTVQDRREDASCVGSATLVTMGRLNGLLTAAHVLDVLPKSGDVGIVLYKGETLQKQVIKMENADRLMICRDKFGSNGPDLGYLQLPEDNVGWLKAINTFYNLSKRRDQVLARQAPAPNCVDAVVGMVDQFTKDVPVNEPLLRAKAFSAIFCDGYIASERNEDGYDILDVNITSYPDFPLPTSFGGMSGGGLWRIYFVEKDGAPTVVDKRLIGVPFYQTRSDAGITTITCHGPEGIYGTLCDAIQKKWPSS